MFQSGSALKAASGGESKGEYVVVHIYFRPQKYYFADLDSCKVEIFKNIKIKAFLPYEPVRL